MTIKIDDSDLLHLLDILEFYVKNCSVDISIIKFAVDMYYQLSNSRQENLTNVDIF